MMRVTEINTRDNPPAIIVDGKGNAGIITLVLLIVLLVLGMGFVFLI